MSPKLKPLLLPQLVEQRRQTDAQFSLASSESIDLLRLCYFTTNSSSEATSPVTPTFSARGHHRLSSSSSSLELGPCLQEPYPSPSQYSAAKVDKRQLPDMQEDPMERYEERPSTSGHFGLYRCLCDAPCQHRSSSENRFSNYSLGDFDSDYDLGFFSDNDLAADLRRPKKSKKSLGDSPFAGFTSKLGSRLPVMRRWRSSTRGFLRTSPAERSCENVLPLDPSSRSSSVSATRYQFLESIRERPGMPPQMAGSYVRQDSGEDLSRSSVVEMSPEEQTDLERDRAMATTPLLPPLLTTPPSRTPSEMPLQSPIVAPPTATSSAAVTPSPGSVSPYSRASLCSKPSSNSLRYAQANGDQPPTPLLPAIVQEHDEWSDRLGHANFTVTPLPYSLKRITADTLAKFQQDWDTARVNYTRHLARVGEHYGQTSNIYALTEAKWAETEMNWKARYDDVAEQCDRSGARNTNATSRSQSRGRRPGRGRSDSSLGGSGPSPADDDPPSRLPLCRTDDGLPGMVPQVLPSLGANGKFPGRGDEDIVGPMQRDAVMLRARSEEGKGRFWRNLADRVGLRK